MNKSPFCCFWVFLLKIILTNNNAYDTKLHKVWKGIIFIPQQPGSFPRPPLLPL